MRRAADAAAAGRALQVPFKFAPLRQFARATPAARRMSSLALRASRAATRAASRALAAPARAFASWMEKAEAVRRSLPRARGARGRPPRPPARNPHSPPTLLPQRPPAPAHRSDAEELVARVPVIEVASRVALCDGGGGATGHPIEYIKLDKRDGHSAATCTYCGLRYKMAAGAHGH